jgi:hypothetical protein
MIESRNLYILYPRARKNYNLSEEEEEDIPLNIKRRR